MRNTLANMRGALFRAWCQVARPRIVIGRGLKLFGRLEIVGPGRVTIGTNCVVSGIPGEGHRYVTIYTNSPDAHVQIGDDARLFAARMSSQHSISIGNDFIMEDAGLADSDFHSLRPDRGDPGEDKKKCRIVIGHGVAIGARSHIGKAVVLGDNVLVLPGSIVNKSIPSGSCVCGNPARIVRNP